MIYKSPYLVGNITYATGMQYIPKIQESWFYIDTSHGRFSVMVLLVFIVKVVLRLKSRHEIINAMIDIKMNFC